jgi:hypothetical protein
MVVGALDVALDAALDINALGGGGGGGSTHLSW